MGKRVLITGADSGIGRAVAIAYAREGAALVLSYLEEEADDARETARWVEKAGRRAVQCAGDITSVWFVAGILPAALEKPQTLLTLAPIAAKP